ncbi:MAG: hypothetical protein NT113_21950, partial [Hyphomicrobiales bacterium]|nr:hypothetical protein [Hyphomicrobiales bacterium]
ARAGLEELAAADLAARLGGHMRRHGMMSSFRASGRPACPLPLRYVAPEGAHIAARLEEARRVAVLADDGM